MENDKLPTLRRLSSRIVEDFFYLIKKPSIVIFLIIIFCTFLTLFYFLIARSSLDYESDHPELDYEYYSRVVSRWEEDKERQDEEEYFSIFFPSKELEEDDKEPEITEEVENDNAEEHEELEEQIIDHERVEEMLTETLFEFFQEREGEMPEIRERAEVWEELGLGEAEEYRGLYEQNIIFLRTLKEVMDEE